MVSVSLHSHNLNERKETIKILKKPNDDPVIFIFEKDRPVTN